MLVEATRGLVDSVSGLNSKDPPCNPPFGGMVLSTSRLSTRMLELFGINYVDGDCVISSTSTFDPKIHYACLFQMSHFACQRYPVKARGCNCLTLLVNGTYFRKHNVQFCRSEKNLRIGDWQTNLPAMLEVNPILSTPVNLGACPRSSKKYHPGTQKHASPYHASHLITQSC